MSVQSDPILELRSVTKRYRTEGARDVLALSDATLAIERSEFVSLIGPSGCGKTTLLKICAGLVGHSKGSLLFEGAKGAPPPERMGVVFQSPVLLPWRTVVENVVLPAHIQGHSLADAKARASDLLSMLQLSGTEESYPWELSGGMQQRVAIARSLLTTPEILFMDEPFGALDAMTRESLNIELQEIHSREGATVLFVTHSISEAVFLSDRVAVMSSGPGRIVDVVDVPLARPRSPDDFVTEEFRQIEAAVRETLNRFAEVA